MKEIRQHATEIAERLLQHSPDGNFICSKCNNGNGQSGTGIYFKDATGEAYCHNCGWLDVIELVKAKYGYDFVEAVNTCADVIGKQVEYEDDDWSANWSKAKKSTAPVRLIKPSSAKNISKMQISLKPYYEMCNKFLTDWSNQIEILKANDLMSCTRNNGKGERGRLVLNPINNAMQAIEYMRHRHIYNQKLIEKFCLGYDPFLNTLVIPHNEFFCTRRYIKDWIDKKGKNHRYKYLANSHTSIFNANCLNEANIIFCCEGAIDAMSLMLAIEYFGIEAIALGSAGNTKLLLEALNKIENRPAIVLLFDDDKSGNEYADELLKELRKNNYFCVKTNLPNQQDANDLLRSNETALKDFINKTVDSVKEKLKDWRPLQMNNEAEIVQNQISNDDEADPLELSTEILEKLMYIEFSDVGNAEKLVEAYGQRFIHYLQDSGRWLDWSGIQWRKAGDSTNTTVLKYMISIMKQLKSFAKERSEFYHTEYLNFTQTKTTTENGNTVISTKELDETEKEHAEKLKTQWIISEAIFKRLNIDGSKRKYIDNAIYIAKGYDRIKITNDDLNTYKTLLNCSNGVIDLETGKLIQHDSSLLMTQCTNTEYIPNYHNEFLEKTIKEILPDDETRIGLMKFLGYGLSGVITEEKAAFLNGGGRNGKGSLMKLYSKTLGSYAVSIPIDVLLLASYAKDGNAPSPEAAKLEFIRVAFSDEIPPNRRLDVAKYKLWTGGDPLAVRELHRDPRMINDPQFKLILSGNNLPTIDDANDIAFKARTLIYPFTQQFTGEKCNPNLKDELLRPEVRSGFLTLLVYYYQLWQREGLTISAAMKQASNEYLEANDAIGNFIDEYCERGTSNEYSISRNEFLIRIKKNIRNITHMTDTSIIEAVKKIAGISYRRGTGGAYKIFGIKWRDPAMDSLLDD